MIRNKNIRYQIMPAWKYPGGVHADAVNAPGTAVSPTDLTWLLHRAAQRMRAALDEVARAHGLAGVRDWIVLSALIADPHRTQLALAQALGLDKTTLTSLLDRLEADGLVVRSLDPHDRRARIPELTDTGRLVQAQVTGARDHAEAELLGAFSADEQRLLRGLLTRLASGRSGGCLEAGGSCI
jgi:MarR family transcriptional regulator, organic hydroperoxide resistance regulator